MKEKILIGFGLILLVVVVVQSVFLYRMSAQVDRLSQNTRSSQALPDTLSGGGNIAPGGSLFPDISKGWNPFEEMQRMQNEMNKIFGDMRSNLYRSPDFDNLTKPFSFSPTLDIKEEDDQFIIKVDIPGSDESNINVRVDDQRLTISATTKKMGESNGQGTMFRSERFMGQFERSVQLPAPVLAEKMTTDYKDGVLTVTVPKA
ncbi:Hsp20/alpha crystallin family protein [Kaarinaea lacus]